MAEDHRREPGCFRIEVECREVVQDIEMYSAHLHDLRLGQRRCPRARVDVAANGDRRRDGSQPFEHVEFTDVPSVNDQLRPLQGVNRLRAKQAVGIGDDSDSATLWNPWHFWNP